MEDDFSEGFQAMSMPRWKFAELLLSNNKNLTVEQLKNRCLMFAYGSNMLKQQVSHRAPSALKYCLGSLDGYTLRFVGRGVASPFPSVGNKLQGVVYSLELIDLFRMHAYEGFPYVYDCKLRPLETSKGLKFAWTYIHHSKQVVKPTDDYLLRVLEGATEAKIDDSHIWEAYNIALRATPITELAKLANQAEKVNQKKSLFSEKAYALDKPSV